MVLIFPNLCLWRRSLRSNLGGIDPEKLYRATLSNIQSTVRQCLSCTKSILLIAWDLVVPPLQLGGLRGRSIEV